MSALEEGLQHVQTQATAPREDPASRDKPVVVGLYGLPGSGKTFLLKQLEQALGQEQFAFYDGSNMIASVVPGGLKVFKDLGEQEKSRWREVAIETIAKQCIKSGKTAMVAGHFMFWSEEGDARQQVWTQKDLDTYTHILYLNVPAKSIADRRRDDMQRSRPSVSVTRLHEWQKVEHRALRPLCRAQGILFAVVVPGQNLVDKVVRLLVDFRAHTEQHNLRQARNRLDDALKPYQGKLKTVFIFDGDRTLAAADTGAIFWENVGGPRQGQLQTSPLQALFSSPLGYSYTAFRQATLLYEDITEDEEFEAVCKKVASRVTMHQKMIALLQVVANQEHIGAVVVTSGLRQVWAKVLDKAGFPKTVKVIGGGRLADGIVVTAAVKAALVTHAQHAHRASVWAFGDSPLDLEMMIKANQAIVVVGEEQTRSKTMDAALLQAIESNGLRARQALLPGNASPRLDVTKLPLVDLTSQEFLDSILHNDGEHSASQVRHATERPAAKLLMTPMRDAAYDGPALREAHRQVGWYLAIEFLADAIGTEECPIRHVQGYPTTGHRLHNEAQTLIVALMRGGESMAFGVNDAFPRAMFLHAKQFEDITTHHLHGQSTVLLVDSVINRGGTVVDFWRHIRRLQANIRVVLVAGVVQAQAVFKGQLADALAQDARLSLVALRFSENKFTGRGTTDTGNRLFNTTQLPDS